VEDRKRKRNTKGQAGRASEVPAGSEEKAQRETGAEEHESIKAKIKTEVRKEERALENAAGAIDEAAGVEPVSHGGEIDRR
jgi:hypothetical protein